MEVLGQAEAHNSAQGEKGRVFSWTLCISLFVLKYGSRHHECLLLDNFENHNLCS